MFNKYWREYPYFLQLFLMMSMIFTLLFASGALASTLTVFITGVPLEEIAGLDKSSSDKVVSAARLQQLLFSLPFFAGVSLLFAYASHPKPIRYLGFKKIQNKTQVFIVIILTIAAIPLVEQLLVWLKMIDLGESVKQMQQNIEIKQEAMLNFTSPFIFLYTLVLFAVVPAIGEELFFRGMLMRFVQKRTGKINFSILLSATVFALFHGEPYSTFPIFFMGILLGYIYYITGSIWLNILAHFIVNGLQVTVLYLARTGTLPESMASMESYPWYVVVVSISVFVAFLYLLHKNKTPMPSNWANDYSDAELLEQEQKSEY